MKRPKFCVGEIVSVVSHQRPDLVCIETEILKAQYSFGFLSTGHEYQGWTYGVTANYFHWCESALRKLPYQEKNGFKAMMEKLQTSKLTEQLHLPFVRVDEMERTTAE